MQKCSKEDCGAPKSLCDELVSSEYQKCQHWIRDKTDTPSKESQKKQRDEGIEGLYKNKQIKS